MAREDEPRVKRWLAESCIAQGESQAQELHKHFSKWNRVTPRAAPTGELTPFQALFPEAPHRPLSCRAFGQCLRALGVPQRVVNGKRLWAIQLREGASR